MTEPVTINLRHIARDLNLPAEKVQATVDLIDDGFPVPFIARYRKDETGNLDEEQIRLIWEELAAQRTLAERKQVILKSIESLGKLTSELDKKIREAKSSKRLEDIYLPFKPKRQTLASAAREKGLEPLALEILNAENMAVDLEKRAADFVDADKKVASVAEALLGAGHIISEIFSEKAELRQQVREIVQRTGLLCSKKVEPEQPKEPAPKKDSQPKKPKKSDSSEASPVENFAETGEQPENVAAETPAADTVATVAEAVENSTAFEPVEDLNTVEETAPATEDVPTPETGEAETVVPEGSGSGGGEEEVPVESPVEIPVEIPVETPPQEPTSELIPDVPEPVLEPEAVAPQAKNPESVGPSEPAEVAAEEVTELFQKAREAMSEKGVPVVKSQNQVKKKKKAEKKKQRENAQQKQREHFENLFRDYFEFESKLWKLTPHRILAINRGEKAKVLRAKLATATEPIIAAVSDSCFAKEHPHCEFLNGCLKDALERLVLPSIERETRSDLTENAETHAVKVFAKNLRNLLLQPPLYRKRVLAMDPGFRHGCKLVALDEFGNVLSFETIYISGSAEKREQAAQKLIDLLEKYKIEVVAIGNGTGCRETEDFLANIIAEKFEGKELAYVIVNEAGASVYSASQIGKEEFPNYDIMARGAVSIGRRLQDPLNELVKVEPASLGVGMYQHDIKAKHLKDSLNTVVESSVNFVGVDLNTAGPAILRFVSGLNQLTAKRIYEYRLENGPFKTREDLKKVSGLGNAAFTHAAGFLRIHDGLNPLDTSWIHPESYELATQVLEKLGFTVDDLRSAEKLKEIAEKTKTVDVEAMAAELSVGPIRLKDILTQLAKPGRDPRESLPPPIFRKGVLKLEDLTQGMELTGTVLNVVDFGAFVDIGLHDSGLIHISHMADRYVRDAHEILSVGDTVRVWVVGLDPKRNRISLTMVSPDAPKQARDDRKPREPREPRERRDSGPKSVAAAAAAEGRVLPPSKSQPRERAPRENDNAPRRDDRRPGGGGSQRDSDKFRDRRGDRNRNRRDEGPKTYVAKPQEKVVAPISEDMKKGKEPLRSFGDLAQLFGRVEPTAETKKKKKDKPTEKPTTPIAEPLVVEPPVVDASVLETPVVETPVVSSESPVETVAENSEHEA